MDICHTKPIWTLLDELVKDIPGWSPLDQLYTMFTLALYAAPEGGDFLEIGSWCGRSGVVIGTAAQQCGCRLHCIDLFPKKEDWKENPDGTFSFVTTINGKTFDGCHTPVWAEPFRKNIAPLYEKKNSVREYFDENISSRGLSGCVSAYHGDSEHCNALNAEGKKISFAFIDGDHSFEAICRDIDRVEPLLLPGAIVCFDDAFSCYDGVDKAIRERFLENPAYRVKQQLTRKFFAAQKK